MMLFTWFVVIDDSQDVHDDETAVVLINSTSAVHDTCGKVFVIVLSYNITYDVSEMTTVLVKTIVGDLYMIMYCYKLTHV